MTDYKQLCAELLDCLEKADWPHKQKHVFEQWVYVARKALAEPEPEGPTYDDLAELCSQHGLDVDSWSLEKFDDLWEIARTVLARWGRPAPQPVPVSERLPGAGDCDAEGRCWCFAYDGSVHGWALRSIEPNVYDTHWLPAHALPVAE